jgi:LssY C-terminus
MTTSRLYGILVVAIAFCIAAVAMLMMRSFYFDPDARSDGDFIARAQQKSVPGIKVSASALGAEESRRSFGENLADYDIQPVWLSIENETDDQLVYLPIAMDPDYYSPYEVSYRFHGAFSAAANRARDKFFLERQIASILPPHSRTTGFMYGVLDAGLKYAHILIARNDRLETFDFVLPVPGPAFVGAGVRADTIYPGQKMEDLDLDTLRATLSKYPCCTTNSDATRHGDPLNLVVVESRKDPIVPFITRDWHLTRKLDIASMVDTAHAFIFRDEYLTSPVSPLYLFDRREDVALQKARSTINERIHARLWLTPYTFESRRVWVGQVSRDIGVRLTDQAWNLTTHKIGPDVDFDRGYLLQDLLMSGMVERYGFVEGVRAAPASAPRKNLTGDPYYTDGLRVVVFLSDQATLMGETKMLPWESPMALNQEAR